MAKKTRRPDLQQLNEGDEIRLVQYEITTEPIPDRKYRRLPARVKDDINRLHTEIQTRPQQAVPELLALIEKHPHVPVFYNYLSIAYERSGRREKAYETIRENYRRNPDYLFARINYAELCLGEGEYEEVAEIFDHTFDLKLLYPKRTRFHVTEAAGFMGVIGRYFLETGDRETAERYYEILQKVAPDQPMTSRLGRQLHPGCLARIVQRLVGFGAAKVWLA